MSLYKPEEMIDYSKLLENIDQKHSNYANANPFPHAVFEDFMVPGPLKKGLLEFPDINSKNENWVYYVHANEKKYGKNDPKEFGPNLSAIMNELNSERFTKFLEQLTGIQGLMPDPTFEGGGLAQSGPGGFLNVHTDFTVHPHHRNWRRQVNLLVYMNEDWKEEYNGHIELWDEKVTHCVNKVLPIFNRALIFTTDKKSFHGFSEKIACPEGMSRKSLNLYYFTEEETAPSIRSTEYRPKPEDPFLKKISIFLDKWIVRIYDFIKRKLNLSDDFASNILGKIDKLTSIFKKKK